MPTAARRRRSVTGPGSGASSRTRKTLRTLQIPITAAKTHLSKLVDAVTLKYERATITRHGEPVAVLISEAEWLNSAISASCDDAQLRLGFRP
ncbi:type II toxin-antitoxin system Phd/YefM family antitoxin [Cryobacterium sp. TMT2-23]|nr:type II toxin-antitoxin system Phd/YefM family antitoxin [Cryobacterium sp. TMT2-23]